MLLPVCGRHIVFEGTDGVGHVRKPFQLNGHRQNLRAAVGTIQISCLVAEIQLLPVYGRHIDFSATRSVGYVI